MDQAHEQIADLRAVQSAIKAFIRSWERKDPPNYDEVSYCFCEFAKDAAVWEDLDSAEEIAASLNIGGVTIPSLHGDTHTLRNFTAEEFSGKFVIFCLGPFIYTERGTSHQSVEK
jgi:hypothetical protein